MAVKNKERVLSRCCLVSLSRVNQKASDIKAGLREWWSSVGCDLIIADISTDMGEEFSDDEGEEQIADSNKKAGSIPAAPEAPDEKEEIIGVIQSAAKCQIIQEELEKFQNDPEFKGHEEKDTTKSEEDLSEAEDAELEPNKLNIDFGRHIEASRLV